MTRVRLRATTTLRYHAAAPPTASWWLHYESGDKRINFSNSPRHRDTGMCEGQTRKDGHASIGV